jgi:hypothetical protein
MATTQSSQPEQTQTQTQTQPNIQTGEIDYYYTNFDGNQIDGSEPKEKSFDSQNGKVTYKYIPLLYNYGVPNAPIIDSCYFEFPEVSCHGGIVSKKETKPALKDGDAPYLKESFSMMFTFNLLDPECVACLNKMDELHKGTARVLAKHKGKVGMYSFNPEHPGEIYKHPIYYKIDPVTCERVAGRNPSLWVKLNGYKNNKTLFTELNKSVIDWALLSEVDVKMIPLLHVEKIYIGGGKASLQIKLHSAIVTDIAPINTRSRQTVTYDRLKQRKGLADTVASQLAQMRMDRQDNLDGGQVHPKNATLPTDSNIGGMHQIPPSAKFQGTQENLAAYLGGAPAMNQTPPVQSTLPHQSVPHQSPVPQLPQVQLPTTAGQQMFRSNTQQIQLPSTGPVPTQLNIQNGATQLPQQLQHSLSQTQGGVQFGGQSGQPVLQIQ